MPIEWFSAGRVTPTVTVASYGLNLNTSAAEYFQGVKRVKIGIDSDKKTVVIKSLRKSLRI